MLFLVMGVVSATESINVYNTEDSNLIADDVDSLSENNKLEISNGVSISQTNIVNSHDDNLGDYCNDEVLNEGAESNDDQQKLTSDEAMISSVLTVQLIQVLLLLVLFPQN